jgi:hypothetical protein
MADRFIIPKRAYKGFDALIALGSEKLNRLSAELAHRDLTLDMAQLSTQLAKTIEADDRAQLERAISTVLIPLSGVRTRLDKSPEQFLDLLTEQTKRRNPTWHTANIAGWRRISAALQKLIAPNSYFSLLYKTFGLLTDHPAVLHEAAILIDSRPVYDEGVGEIKAMLLTSTLVLNYSAEGRTKRLHLALDFSDMQNIKEQLDRAQRKFDLLEKKMTNLGIPALISQD